MKVESILLFPKISKIWETLTQIKETMQPIYIVVFLSYCVISAGSFVWSHLAGANGPAFLTSPLLNPIYSFFLVGLAYILGIVTRVRTIYAKANRYLRDLKK